MWRHLVFDVVGNHNNKKYSFAIKKIFIIILIRIKIFIIIKIFLNNIIKKLLLKKYY